MPNVIYNNYHITDPHIDEILERLADHFKSDVRVVGGDRAPNAHPKGGSPNSLHYLQNGGRAADFHVRGLSDFDVFRDLCSHLPEVFDADKTYELLIHGTFTKAEGPHLHLGRYGPDHPEAIKNSGAIWVKTEGLAPEKKGVVEKTLVSIRVQNLHSTISTPANSVLKGSEAKCLDAVRRGLVERHGHAVASEGRTLQQGKETAHGPSKSSDHGREHVR